MVNSLSTTEKLGQELIADQKNWTDWIYDYNYQRTRGTKHPRCIDTNSSPVHLSRCGHAFTQYIPIMQEMPNWDKRGMQEFTWRTAGSVKVTEVSEIL